MDYPLIIALIGALGIGVATGITSCYAVLKEQSLLGDAIAHASLPGICLAFLITLNRSPLALLTGALIAGMFGIWLITQINRHSFLKTDTALGVILSVFFGFGTMLLTVIQTIPTARQAGIDTFIFGQIASLLITDIGIIWCVSGGIVAVTLIFWKEFKIILFDANYATGLGISVPKISLLLNSLLVISIVIGLQSVGVILMSALVIAPATAAKQWSHNLGWLMILSVLFSCVSCVGGVLFSSAYAHLPSGPTIVVLISLMVIVSLLGSSNGIIAKAIQRLSVKKTLQIDTIINGLYALATSHDDHSHPHDIRALTFLNHPPSPQLLKQLMNDGYVYQSSVDHWGLTEAGIARAIQNTKAYP
jgi:manganese/zinc/iron transport system permease protein